MPPRRIDFSTALSKFAPQLRGPLNSVILRDGFEGIIPAASAQMLAQFFGISLPSLMLELLHFATAYAQPAISEYRVGAIAQGATGNLYFGANMEFPGRSLIYTVHAEQAATVNAWVNGETGMSALAVSAAPCGYCRQFLNELVTANQLQIYLAGKPPRPMSYYLPDAFGPRDLGVSGGMLSPQTNHLALDKPNDDPVVQAALAAANRSYAPYTSSVNPNGGKACYAGVALATADGGIFSGAYGENAAYNPSILPMAAALVRMNLCGSYSSPIRQAVLVQGHALGQDDGNPVCDQQAASRDVLHAATDTPLTVMFAHQ